MKFSIITVNLNNLHGLQKTMSSILSQTSKDYEWIVIDGGSTDGSKELIEQYAEHITYWVSEPDNGIFDAMNKGIKFSHGEYLLFLNSGDCLYENTTIDKFLKIKSDSDVIYGNTVVVDGNGKEHHKWIAPQKIKFSSFFKGGINHQSAFIKRNCFEFRQYEDNIGADTHFFILLLAHDCTFEKFNEFVSKYDNTGVSSSVGSQQYYNIVMNSLPRGARDDYADIILFQEVDLAIMIKKIIGSPRIIRNIGRLLIYPLYYTAVIIKKIKES